MRAGSGRPTADNKESTSSRRCFRFNARCARITSAICTPAGSTGFRAIPGSWDISEISAPRTFCSSGSANDSRLRPQKRMDPPARRPAGGNRRRTASAVVVFPQPDSPNNPTTSPRLTSKLTPRSTGTGHPDLESNWTARSRTSSSGSIEKMPSQTAAVWRAPPDRASLRIPPGSSNRFDGCPPAATFDPLGYHPRPVFMVLDSPWRNLISPQLLDGAKQAARFRARSHSDAHKAGAAERGTEVAQKNAPGLEALQQPRTSSSKIGQHKIGGAGKGLHADELQAALQLAAREPHFLNVAGCAAAIARCDLRRSQHGRIHRERRCRALHQRKHICVCQ